MLQSGHPPDPNSTQSLETSTAVPWAAMIGELPPPPRHGLHHTQLDWLALDGAQTNGGPDKVKN